MQIHSNLNNPQFKALKVANIQKTLGNQTSSIDLYLVRREDYCFLQNLSKKVNFKERCKNIAEYYCERWQKVFNYCIDSAFNAGNVTYIAISDNKPCGIMTFFNCGKFHLDGICSIPDEKGKKTPFVGQSLFYELFKVAKEEQAKEITLGAVVNGISDNIKIYEKLGFKKNPVQTSEYVDMNCNKYRVAEQLRTFEKEMSYSDLKCQRTQLDKFID